MSIRTDLAVETLDFAQNRLPQGVSKELFHQDGVEVTRVRVKDEHGSAATGKPIGEYLTMDTSDFRRAPSRFEAEVEALAALLGSLLPKGRGEAPALVVGLGNRDITPDALGPKAASYILATRHITKELAAQIGLEALTPVAVIAAGVTGQTGIETAEITAAVVRTLAPWVVIAIDSLASKSVERLATTVQIANTGISPGSGVQNSRIELSEHTLGVPVISVGVPMVVDMLTVACDLLGDQCDTARLPEKSRTMMVTPREIDLAVEHAAKTVAFSINRALQPALTLDELMSLAG